MIDAGLEKHQTLRKLLPKQLYSLGGQLKRAFVLLMNCAYDCWRYATYSSAVKRGDSAEKLRALITLRYHSIEKGLSLPQPRPGFGKAEINVLLGYIDQYLDQYGPARHLTVPVNALLAYTKFNLKNGLVDPVLDSRISAIQSVLVDNFGPLMAGGGAMTITAESIKQASMTAGPEFFTSRYSIRQFSDVDVSLDAIEAAVRLAQKAPAVCNRQSARVWLIADREDIRKALTIQGGARGFGDGVNKLLVVTSDLSNFQGMGERYQSWIDGGLFAMSLIYALHSKGLGTCCLNWSKEHAIDRQFKSFLKMPPSETIILALAVGNLPAEIQVAQSCRKPLDEVLVKYASSGTS